MKLKLECIFLMLFLIVSTAEVWSQERSIQEVPWDSVVASIKAIDASLMSDSVKGALLKQLFESYHITLNDYQLFYQEMMNDSPQKQTRFLGRVKELLEKMVKEEYKVRKKPKGKPASRDKPTP